MTAVSPLRRGIVIVPVRVPWYGITGSSMLCRYASQTLCMPQVRLPVWSFGLTPGTPT
jgi:hypothetical protein